MNEIGTTTDNNNALECRQGSEQCAQESEQEGKIEYLGLMSGEGELVKGEGLVCIKSVGQNFDNHGND